MEAQIENPTRSIERTSATGRRDQAEMLRRLVLQAAGDWEPRSERAGALMMVVGASPGAGASTVALHLALRLHRRGWPVGWLDARVTPQLLDGSDDPSAQVTWHEVVRGERTLREAWHTGDEGLPTLLAPGGVMARDALGDRSAWDQLRHAARQQLVVVDGGTIDPCHPAFGWVDHLCIVADENHSPVAEIYAAIKRVVPSLGGARCWLLLNRVQNAQRASESRQRIVAACQRFLHLALCPAGELPDDPHMDDPTSRRPWIHIPPTRQRWDQVYGQWVQRLEDLWTARPRWTRWGH